MFRRGWRRVTSVQPYQGKAALRRVSLVKDQPGRTAESSEALVRVSAVVRVRGKVSAGMLLRRGRQVVSELVAETAEGNRSLLDWVATAVSVLDQGREAFYLRVLEQGMRWAEATHRAGRATPDLAVWARDVRTFLGSSS